MTRSLTGFSSLCTYLIYSFLISLSVCSHASSVAPDHHEMLSTELSANDTKDINTQTIDTQIGTPSTEAPLLIAENLVVGSIRQLVGKAMLHKQGEVRGTKASSGDVLKAQDILRTKRNSHAVVQLIDGSTIVLQEKSSLHLKGLQSLSLEEGTVLFDIRKRGASKGLKVATKTAVIGVKGTQFLVKDENNQVDVYLNEGNVEVNPIEGSFKHYKAVSTASFDDYSQQIMTEFQQEKNKMQEGVNQMKREFVDYLNSFDMNPGTAVSISGDELTSYPMPNHYDELFKELEQQAELTRQKFEQQSQ